MFGIAQGLVFLLQLLQLVVAEGEVFQLLQLIAEQLMAGALFIAAAGKAFQLAAGLFPALGCQLHLTGQITGAGIFIEQPAVGVGFEQGLVFVLAVNVDQQLAKCLEIALWAGAAIDIGA